MIGRICSLQKMQLPLRDRGLLSASGLTVPIDGTDGYQTSCTFQHTDGGAGDALYVNIGSVTSCEFVPLESAESLTIAELVDVADGFTTRLVESGTYASTGCEGVVLSATNKRPVSWLFDDGDAALGAGDYRAELSRVLLTTDQTAGITLNAIRGQIKALDGIDISSAGAVVSPITGYLELAGTGARTLNGHVACVRAALEEGASGTTTIGKYLAGFEATLSSTRTYAGSGLSAAFLADLSGGTSLWQHGLYLEDSACLTGITIGTCTTAGIDVGSAATGITLTGTYSSNAMDFSNATIDPSGSAGPCMIRMGTYGSEIDYGADTGQSGCIRTYTTCSGASGYDRGIFACTVTTSGKGAFPVAGLAEANNTGTGPKALMGGQFIAHLGARSSGATLVTRGGDATAGMYGIWAKVAASGTAVCDSGSRIAPIWCDSQMSGTVSGDEFGIFASTGASRPDAFIGFNTTSSGYDQLMSFDTTFNSGAGTCVTTDSVPSTQDARAKVWYDGKQYYIPLYR